MMHPCWAARVKPFKPERLSLLLLTAALAGCMEAAGPAPALTPLPPDPARVKMYSERQDHGYTVPGVDVAKIDPKYLRQLVDYDTDQPAGTIVVDSYNRFLYLVMQHGKAMRYGVGVAKAGLEFEGTATIARKAAWPHWTPTPDMIKREPERYGPLAKGMEGGTKNPLGARALYLFKDGKDTLYRLHGTTEPWSIGKSVSSGCIRLLDQDIMDLYQRVPRGSRVVVLGPDGKSQGES